MKNLIHYLKSSHLMVIKRLISYFIIGWLAIIFIGCDGGDSSSSTDNSNSLDLCSVEMKNAFVYEVMTDSYLWYDKLPKVNPASYSSPEKLLEDLIYKPFDRWSYITSTAEFYAYYIEGKYIGTGIALGFDDKDNIRVKYVYRNSPAFRSGIKRGDIITRINGKSPMEITQENLWNDILGPDEIGVMLSLEVMDLDGTIYQIDLKKEWVNVYTVLHDEILSIGSKKVGYLVYTSFLETSVPELDAVFSKFKAEKIDDLIIDLRYNSGGIAWVSLYLANLICGNHLDGQIFVKYIHNNKYSHLNHSWVFSKNKQSLNLKRLFVISSRSTCSASEMIINGLSPYIDTILIGNTTCGKPVGMYGHDYCDIHLSPIEFKIANAFDEGDYYWGIAPDCYATDDLSRNFGDPNEASLKETLYYLNNNSCTRSLQRSNDMKQSDIPFKGLKREIGAF